MSSYGEGLALEALIELEESSQAIHIDIAATGFDAEGIKKDLEKGFHIHIEYHIRVYRNVTGLVKLFGDELLYEEHPSCTGSWDVFSGNYEIRYENGKRIYVATWEEFHRRFFHLERFPFSLSRSSVKPTYVLAQVRLRKIILNPPMNIITAFFDSKESLTGWKRLEIKR